MSEVDTRPSPHPSKEQIEFVEESIAAIGSVGASVDDLAWWATWIAAKNPFLSKVDQQFDSIWRNDPLPETGFSSYLGEWLQSLYSSVKFSIRLCMKLGAVHRAFDDRIRLAHSDLRKAYLIKTFAYPGSFGTSSLESPFFNDPFFCELPQYLETNGFNVISVIHPIGCLPEAIQLCPAMKAFVFPYQAFAKRRDVLWAYSKIFTALFKRFSPVQFRGKNVATLLRRQYLLDLCSPSGVEHFLYFRAFSRIAEFFQPSHLTLTLENNPFERMCVSAMRGRSPLTKIIGYHPTTINMSALNMYPAAKEIHRSPHPDLLLTAGKEPLENLKRYGHYDDPSLQIRAACALRYRYLETLQCHVEEPKQVLLVILDGLPQARLQIDYVLEEASSIGGWEIVIREHPAMTLRDYGVESIDLERTPNVKVSRGSLQHDLQSAGVVLYSESTVALEAVARGLPVIHWDHGKILNNDPLFYCTHFKWSVQKRGDLSRTLEIIGKTPLKDLERSHGEIMTYIRRYFHAVNETTLKNFV